MWRKQRGNLLISTVLLGIVALIVAGVIDRGGARGDDPYPTLPPEKQAAVDKEHKLNEQALAATPGPSAEKTPAEAKPWSSPWPSGILDGGDLAIHGNPYVFENHWQDLVEGNHVQVYAGALAEDPSQGVLFVRATSIDLHPVEGGSGLYETPVRAGSVQIASADGARLTLASVDGTTFVFDVASRQWSPGDGSLSPSPVVSATPVAPGTSAE